MPRLDHRAKLGEVWFPFGEDEVLEVPVRGEEGENGGLELGSSGWER
jgi:hypothetical protein